MSKRQTAEELIQEITRLARGIFYWRDWHVKNHREKHGKNTAFPYDEYVSPGMFMSLLVYDAQYADEEFEKVYKTDQDTLEYWLAQIDPSKLRFGSARFVLREFQSWYSHEGSDIRAYRSEVSADAYTDFLEDFRRDVGFDFLSESGSVRKLALKVLKRGAISSERNWETLQEVCVDVSQTILSKVELTKLSKIMDAYEAAQ